MEDPCNEFVKDLRPKISENNADDKILYDYSFISAKDRSPAAFSTVAAVDGESVIFQQISAARSFREIGVFLLPLAASIDRIFQEGKFKRLSYVINSENANMNSIESIMFSSLKSSKRHNICIS